MNKILILSEKESDFSKLILENCSGSKAYMLDDENIPFEDFDSVCILCGTAEKPVMLSAPTRIKIEKIIAEGKPVFCEYLSSICSIYSDNPIETSHHRMVYSDEYIKFSDLSKGDILDGHKNHILPYYFVPSDAKPILTYHDYICAHDNIEMDDETFKGGKWALWFLNDNTLISSIRMANFNKARLAPSESWHKIIESIICFLCAEKISVTFPQRVYKTGLGKTVEKSSDVDFSVSKGLNWYKRANMLKKDGKLGVLEGFSHCISARDGKQELLTHIRTDCTAETGGAFLLDYLLTGNTDSYNIFKNTQKFSFDYMQIKEGAHRGMIRWTEGAWEVCYQDDVARVLLPTLLQINFGDDKDYLDEVKSALYYLMDSTGEDGLGISCTECVTLNDARKAELKKAGVGIPCAHHNAFYHTVLLLASRAGAGKEFAEVAIKGLSSIMKLYPDTLRETSETEEMCRLVFPLAVLYEYTKEKEHYEWLHRVVKDLEKVQHSSYGYAEWDTDYKAKCSRNHTGECALLANNGDPVADLLYSNNWLPLGFAYAYMVTKEEIFYSKWKEIATFFLNCQLHSEDALLDGAWTRAMDLNRMESYGVPHDVGWAPCCIETGWTVGEILIGLQFMKMAEKMVNGCNNR